MSAKPEQIMLKSDVDVTPEIENVFAADNISNEEKEAVVPEAVIAEKVTASEIEEDESVRYGELWRTEPSKRRRMGLAQITLDRGVKTEVIGHLYGLDFDIEAEGYRIRIFFDHYNFRLKILDYEATDYPAMIKRVHWLASENSFEKIFWKASEEDWRNFLSFGYGLEGIMKYYFNGEDAFVMSRFCTTERIHSADLIEEAELIEKLMARPRAYEPPPLPPGYRMTIARPEHIAQLVKLYRGIFQTYPSPLTHPDYIYQTMNRHVLYRVVLNEDGDVVSAASAEIDEKNRNAELTDCATAPSARGQGLMFHLLQALESDLRERNITTSYTLARGTSFGMNLVFYRLGHEYCGRLINNCDIYGQFEDMNIWSKLL